MPPWLCCSCVCDVCHQLFDSKGSVLREFGRSEFVNGDAPRVVAVDRSGNWFVSQILHERVLVFAADGSYITAFGQYGTEDGCCIGPRVMCIDCEGRILVGDHTPRIQVFGFFATI